MTLSPYAIPLQENEWQQLFHHLRHENPRPLFHDEHIRKAIVKRRAELFMRDDAFQGDKSRMIDIAVEYNRRHMHGGLESHSQRLIWPLAMLDPFYETRAQAKVLSIGCRTEGEVFKLIAAGFTPENITAIDIVSNSPLVQVMDMHAMTFAADTFDAIVLGWTIPYSRQPTVAFAEMCRVVKNGGVIAIGLTREPETSPEHAQLLAQGSATYLSSAEIMTDFPGDVVLSPLLVQEPLDQGRKGAILLIVRVHKPATA